MSQVTASTVPHRLMGLRQSVSVSTRGEKLSCVSAALVCLLLRPLHYRTALLTTVVATLEENDEVAPEIGFEDDPLHAIPDPFHKAAAEV